RVHFTSACIAPENRPLVVLPAGLRHARDQSLRGKLAKRQPRDFEPADERAAAARDFATVHDPRRAGVAGELGQTGVILLRLELGPERGVFLHRRALAFIAINPGCLCHKGTPNLIESDGFSTAFTVGDDAVVPGSSPPHLTSNPKHHTSNFR